MKQMFVLIFYHSVTLWEICFLLTVRDMNHPDLVNLIPHRNYAYNVCKILILLKWFSTYEIVTFSVGQSDIEISILIIKEMVF